MTTQTHDQTEAFPRSTMEILEQLRGVHATALEKATLALDALSDDEKIARRYDKAEEKVAACRELLRNIDLALIELRGLEPAAEPVLAAAIDRLGAENISVTFGKVADAVDVVVAVYPGDDPHATEVGPHTQYAELVADYLSAVGIDAELNDFDVAAEDEIGTNGGGGRNLHAPIQQRDYGKRLLVRRVAKESAA